MKTFITAFPIDKPLQEKLGIYSSGYVQSISVGKILHSLIKAGYTDIYTFVECTGQTGLAIHCSKPTK